MNLRDKVVVVTGGANGIGAALCRRFAAEGARSVSVVDLDGATAEQVAQEIGGLAFGADVSEESALIDLVQETERRVGPIDLFCSNAGVGLADGPTGGAASAPDADWHRSWTVNVMAHVYAARAVLPGMIARGSGYLLNTVSAAGLLNQIGAAPYSTTKHAAIGFAEALAITHGDQGIRVSVLCPQYVETAMTAELAERGLLAGSDVIPVETVADSVIEGLREERFLILPHPQVLEYLQHKTGDYDRWLAGMRRLRRSLGDAE